MASSINPQPKYHVFLSFSGEDTRYGFTSHVDAALSPKNIKTFIDKQLKEGEEIEPGLLKAIEESRISLVIFSVNYASSRWCLDELVKIIECKNMRSQIVIPVFYHVDPSDVEKQSGTFGEKFAELKGRDKYKAKLELHQKWKEALDGVDYTSPWHLDGEKDEAVILKDIVNHVFRILSYMYPSDDKHLVGLQSRIRKVESLLRIWSNDIVLRVGIWGMGGIGKTTIAKAVFNKIFREFDGYFFAENVSEELESRNGVRSVLRQNLLSAILRDPNANINVELTRQRFGHKKFLIVFDDVKSPEEIRKLIGDLDCFKGGSRIIITTRDKQVLEQCRVEDNNIFKVKGLSHHEALQVFSWCAFDKKYLDSGYHTLSDRVVKYAKGVPLALVAWGDTLLTAEDQHRVWGDILFTKDQLWKSAIKKLQRELHEKIHNELIGKREIEGICFDMSEVSKMELSDPNVFKEMRNLRFLKIYNSYCEKDKISKIDVPNGLESVFSKLRYLCWHGSPLNPLQLTRNLHNLIVLDMPYSTVEQLWTDAPNLVNLKRINLSHSKNLHKIPDLSVVKNLESLILEGCISLSEISSSVQCLNNLVILNLRHCTSLNSLPTGIYRLKSLQHFDLSGCWKLDGLLEGLGNLYIDYNI